jgi:cytoskeletal protein CcmA (bactofilin family)
MLEVKRKPASHSHGAAAPAKARAQKHDLSTGPPSEHREFQAKFPAVTGEVHFKGTISIDGLLSGQMGANTLGLRQRSSVTFVSQPELIGEIRFKDMVRVNGHIAGTVFSQKGTLIVDTGANVEGDIDVAVAVIGGNVKGDIVARERVELGPASKICGTIWTRSIVIRDGAIFEGECRMIEEAKEAS